MTGGPTLAGAPSVGVPGALGRLARLVVCVVVTTAPLVGCSDNGGAGTDPTANDDMSPTEQLLARPTAEEAVVTYRGQLVRVRAELKKLVPDVEWDDQQPVKVGESACQDPFGRIDGTSTLSFATGGGAIPDDDWDRAVRIIMRVLEPEGYDQVRVIVDRPGQHEVVFTDEYDSYLELGGQVSTTIDITTGCLLSADAHDAAAGSRRRLCRSLATGPGGAVLDEDQGR